MGTSTFSGPIRSEDGLKTVAKNATTGVFTEHIVASSGGVLEVQKVATSGRDNIVAAGTSTGANNAVLALLLQSLILLQMHMALVLLMRQLILL